MSDTKKKMGRPSTKTGDEKVIYIEVPPETYDRWCELKGDLSHVQYMNKVVADLWSQYDH